MLCFQDNESTAEKAHPLRPDYDDEVFAEFLVKRYSVLAMRSIIKRRADDTESCPWDRRSEILFRPARLKWRHPNPRVLCFGCYFFFAVDAFPANEGFAIHLSSVPIQRARGRETRLSRLWTTLLSLYKLQGFSVLSARPAWNSKLVTPRRYSDATCYSPCAGRPDLQKQSECA